MTETNLQKMEAMMALDEFNRDGDIAKLEKKLATLDDSFSKEEFAKAFEEVVKYVLQIEKKTIEDVEKLKQAFELSLGKIHGEASDSLGSLKKQVDKVFVEERLNEMRALIDRKISEVKDGEVGPPGKQGVPGLDGSQGSPDTPEKIKNKLESLKGDKRLDKKAIKGLEEWLEAGLKKNKTSIVYAGGGGSSGGRIVKSYDLTSSLNGVLKTFSLPAFWRVISVQSSSFPNAFRETVDWTSDASAMSVTFTSEIDAASTLATGQTITIIYSE